MTRKINAPGYMKWVTHIYTNSFYALEKQILFSNRVCRLATSRSLTFFWQYLSSWIYIGPGNFTTILILQIAHSYNEVHLWCRWSIREEEGILSHRLLWLEVHVVVVLVLKMGIFGKKPQNLEFWPDFHIKGDEAFLMWIISSMQFCRVPTDFERIACIKLRWHLGEGRTTRGNWVSSENAERSPIAWLYRNSAYKTVASHLPQLLRSSDHSCIDISNVSSLNS